MQYYLKYNIVSRHHSQFIYFDSQRNIKQYTCHNRNLLYSLKHMGYYGNILSLTEARIRLKLFPTPSEFRPLYKSHTHIQDLCNF